MPEPLPDSDVRWDTRDDTRWNPRAIQAQLAVHWHGLGVEVLEQAVSTNTALLERVRLAQEQEREQAQALVQQQGGATLAVVRRSVESAAFGRRPAGMQPCLLVAEQQTGGRGRQGRVWQSAPGASLTFSLALPLQVADWSGLSLAVGVAVADALEPSGGGPTLAGAPRAGAQPAPTPRQARPCIGLKWPNDLWLMHGPGAGRKLGGILVETVAAGASRWAVIGIGLNIGPMETSGASTGFASLQELDAAATAPGALQQIALPLVLALKQFEQQGFAAFAQRFAARDLLQGQPVRTTQPNAPVGVARGVSAQGALLVDTDAGLVAVSSGEVSVRPNPARDGAADEAVEPGQAGAPALST